MSSIRHRPPPPPPASKPPPLPEEYYDPEFVRALAKSRKRSSAARRSRKEDPTLPAEEIRTVEPIRSAPPVEPSKPEPVEEPICVEVKAYRCGEKIEQTRPEPVQSITSAQANITDKMPTPTGPTRSAQIEPVRAEPVEEPICVQIKAYQCGEQIGQARPDLPEHVRSDQAKNIDKMPTPPGQKTSAPVETIKSDPVNERIRLDPVKPIRSDPVEIVDPLPTPLGPPTELTKEFDISEPLGRSEKKKDVSRSKLTRNGPGRASKKFVREAKEERAVAIEKAVSLPRPNEKVQELDFKPLTLQDVKVEPLMTPNEPFAPTNNAIPNPIQGLSKPTTSHASPALAPTVDKKRALYVEEKSGLSRVKQEGSERAKQEDEIKVSTSLLDDVKVERQSTGRKSNGISAVQPDEKNDIRTPENGVANEDVSRQSHVTPSGKGSDKEKADSVVTSSAQKECPPRDQIPPNVTDKPEAKAKKKGVSKRDLIESLRKLEQDFKETVVAPKSTSTTKSPQAKTAPPPPPLPSSSEPKPDPKPLSLRMKSGRRNLIGGLTKLNSFLALAGGDVRSNRLTEIGVTCIVNVFSDPASKISIQGVDNLDVSQADLVPSLDRVVDRIDRVRRTDGLVLVHSDDDDSESAAICIAYFIKYERMDMKQAYKQMKQRLPNISPHNDIYFRLEDFERRVKSGRPSRIMAMVMGIVRFCFQNWLPVTVVVLLVCIFVTFALDHWALEEYKKQYGDEKCCDTAGDLVKARNMAKK